MTETQIKPTEEVNVSNGIYAKYIKRAMDCFLSFCAIVVLSPIMIILTVVGAIAMKGNPFFTQLRPGKNEKIFRLIKFRTMSCQTDKDGNLLPDDKRLTKYGKFLRSTSLDELPELINILKGDMAIVGPRPLMARYVKFYNDFERKRHLVRPGLTGYAQVHGRNTVSWDERMELDVYYISKVSFVLDIKIIFSTILIVLKREGIELSDIGNFDDYKMRKENELYEVVKGK